MVYIVRATCNGSNFILKKKTCLFLFFCLCSSYMDVMHYWLHGIDSLLANICMSLVGGLAHWPMGRNTYIGGGGGGTYHPSVHEGKSRPRKKAAEQPPRSTSLFVRPCLPTYTLLFLPYPHTYIHALQAQQDPANTDESLLVP